MDEPIIADTVVQRTGVEGKPISREFETTRESGGGNTKGKTAGETKVRHARHSSGLSAFDVQHNGTPCLFCFYTCTLTPHFCKRNPWEAKSRTKDGTKIRLIC